MQIFKQLYNKIKHLNKYTFYTDNRSDFAEALHKQINVIRKKYRMKIEREMT